MSKKRLFDDPCGIARALNAVGERWALLVVRELVFGPKRYSDLHRGLPQMSQNVLAQRLRELAADGLVRRGAWDRLRPPPCTNSPSAGRNWSPCSARSPSGAAAHRCPRTARPS